MTEAGEVKTIDLGCYGRVTARTLRDHIKSDQRAQFWQVLSMELLLGDLSTNGTGDSISTGDIFSPDNHKFTLTFWKGVLEWLEHDPGQETVHYACLLAETIQIYLTFDITDQTTFKILKYLAAGFLKLMTRLAPAESRPMSDHITDLVYTLYTMGSSLEGVANFLTVFRSSVGAHIKFDADHVIGSTDGDGIDPELNGCPGNVSGKCAKTRTVHLVSLLSNCRLSQFADIFTLLRTAAPVPHLMIYPLGNSNRPVSVTHFAIYKLSGLCTQIRSCSDLQTVETTLIQHVLSYSCVVHVVAANVLLFLVRLANPHYISSLLHFLVSLLPVTHCHIKRRYLGVIISRIMIYSGPELQKQIQEQLTDQSITSSSASLHLCSDVRMKNSAAMMMLNSWLSSEMKTDRLTAMLLSGAPCTGTALLSLLRETSHGLVETRRVDFHVDRLANLYQVVVAVLVNVRQNWKLYRCEANELLKVLTTLARLDDVMVPSLLLDVFGRFSSFQSSSSGDYCDVSTTLISLLMKSDSFYIASKCLDTVATFAKMTPHPEILSCLAKNLDIKTRLSTFFKSGITPSTVSMSHPAAVKKCDLIHTISQHSGQRLIVEHAIRTLEKVASIPLHSVNKLSRVIMAKNLENCESGS